jgi:hypothetical protein
MITTSKDKGFYITVRDPRAKTSKTMTVRGPRLTPTRILQLILRAIRDQKEKVG